MMRTLRFLQPIKILIAPVILVKELLESERKDKDFSATMPGEICPSSWFLAKLTAVSDLHELRVIGKLPVNRLLPRLQKC